MLEFRIVDSTCIYKKPVKSKATDKKKHPDIAISTSRTEEFISNIK